MVLYEMMIIPVHSIRKILLKYFAFSFIRKLKRSLEYLKDISGAMTGRLTGYRLFGHSIVNYPFALPTGIIR